MIRKSQFEIKYVGAKATFCGPFRRTDGLRINKTRGEMMKRKSIYCIFMIVAAISAVTFISIVSANSTDRGRGDDKNDLQPDARPEASTTFVISQAYGGGAVTTPPVRLFSARMSGANEVPANSTTGSGYGRVVLNDAETQITASFYWSGLTGNANAGHIHCCGAVGVAAGVHFTMGPAAAPSGSKVDPACAITAP